MHNPFEEPIFPIVICDGFCGLGKAEEEVEGIPYFYASTFHKEKTVFFQPKHYFPLKDLPKIHLENTILTTSFIPNELDFSKAFENFQKILPLEKVVLARRKTHTLQKPFSPLEILSTLFHTFEKKSLFAYFEKEEMGFFGATPENLYTRVGREIISDAIAGTTLYKNKADLYTSKNIKEHNFVTKMIQEALTGISSNVKVSDASIKKAHHLCHIHKTISATLHENITDHDIIHLLHPTPATAGYPKALATSFLAEEESFNREFYAGPLGWISPEKAKIKVALRCGRQQGSMLHLYAGAGVIKESDPIKELEEIENKFHTIEEALFETVPTY
ncbi:chorismate-binding protein [bacterium]|nr:chorismate-binding protein [bacterium]